MEVHMTLDSDVQTRMGVHADTVMLHEKDGVARLDFILCDIPMGDGEIRGVLSSRVFMAVDDLKILRDEIDGLIHANVPGGPEDD